LSTDDEKLVESTQSEETDADRLRRLEEVCGAMEYVSMEDMVDSLE